MQSLFPILGLSSKSKIVSEKEFNIKTQRNGKEGGEKNKEVKIRNSKSKNVSEKEFIAENTERGRILSFGKHPLPIILH
jgi:hypothetical protein